MNVRHFLIPLIPLFAISGCFPLHAIAAVGHGPSVYTYRLMEGNIRKLEHKYPDLIHASVIGKTAFGRNIYAVSVGKGRTTVLLTAAHHAREWITTVLAMKITETYARAYKTDTHLDGYSVRRVLDHTTIWIIPMANPDGVTLQQFGIRAFPRRASKTFILWNDGKRTFREWKANAQGIDLNRQYDGEWHHIESDVRNIPGSKNYKGKKPYEANEVKAIVHLIQKVRPKIEVAFHASGKVIFCGPRPVSEFSWRAQYGRDLARMTGYKLLYTDVTHSGGGLTDWWTHTLKKPGYTVEVGPFFGEHPVPMRYFSEIWKRNRTVGLYIATQAFIQDSLPETNWTNGG